MNSKNPLTKQILAYFGRNPDEWLTLKDMAIKFGCTRHQAEQACYQLNRAGTAKRETTIENGMYLVRMVQVAQEAA